ncbi:MAG: hypothetical protein EHM57_08525, partial [Actinobacteria bacterium]
MPLAPSPGRGAPCSSSRGATTWRLFVVRWRPPSAAPSVPAAKGGCRRDAPGRSRSSSPTPSAVSPTSGRSELTAQGATGARRYRTGAQLLSDRGDVVTEALPSLDELLTKLVSVEGSDLHLKVGSPPAYRINGSLHLSNLEKLTPEATEHFLGEILPDRMRAAFAETNEADFAYGKASLGRFRVNCYRQRGSISIVVRAVSPASRNFADLGLPPIVERLCDEHRGMVLVTGPTGSGKTTTIGAMIDYINSNHRVNIITL